ncbi:hypothetical protein KAR48_01870 [bacterium]|nr:hypothetical protein [bacterium]
MYKKFITLFFMIVITLTPVYAQRQRQQRRPQNTGQEKIRIAKDAEKRVLQFLEELLPGASSSLQELKNKRPVIYRRRIQKYFKELQHIERVKEIDSGRYQNLLKEKRLELESNSLALKYRNASDDSNRTVIKKELEELLYKLFDCRQENRDEELKLLEERVNKLRERNQKRLHDKLEIVDKRLKQLLGEKEQYEW